MGAERSGVDQPPRKSNVHVRKNFATSPDDALLILRLQQALDGLATASARRFWEQMHVMGTAAVKGSLHVVCLATITLLGALNAMAIEEASYNVVATDGAFEIRDYAPHVVAETLVEGTFEEAGNTAFNRLFRYISVGNRSREKVAMTAPVAQQRVRERWAVSFMMPAAYTLETLPAPEDPQVTLRQVPARRIAAVRYSGSWSEKGYLRHRAELESWMRGKGLAAAGEPQWARYNSPFALWFLRRNEILIPVTVGAE